MSQFRQRFQSPPSSSINRETDVKLRMQGASYSSENPESPYFRRQIENERIKNLSFWDNTDSEGHEESEWAERQSPMPFILGTIILVVVSTLLWFIFRWISGENTNNPPIIAADTTPFKVRPENPGGMMIPHQDKLIYGRLSQDTPQPVERLLPPPEQPMIAQPPSTQGAQMATQQVETPQMSSPMVNNPGGVIAQPQQPYPQSQGYMQPQQGYAPNPPIPQSMQQQPTVQTQSPQTHQQPYPQGSYPQQQPYQGQAPNQMPVHQQSPYGTPSPSSVPSPSPNPQIPLQSASNPIPPKQLSPVEDIKPASDDKSVSDEEDKSSSINYDGQNDLDKLIAREADKPLKRIPKKTDKKEAKQIPIDSGKYKIQIASLPSRAMAEHEMKRLRTQHPSIFQNKPWNIQRVNLGADRGFTHRLIVGSFSNQNNASKFCKKLRAEKIGCVVIAPVKE